MIKKYIKNLKKVYKTKKIFEFLNIASFMMLILCFVFTVIGLTNDKLILLMPQLLTLWGLSIWMFVKTDKIHDQACHILDENRVLVDNYYSDSFYENEQLTQIFQTWYDQKKFEIKSTSLEQHNYFAFKLRYPNDKDNEIIAVQIDSSHKLKVFINKVQPNIDRALKASVFSLYKDTLVKLTNEIRCKFRESCDKIEQNLVFNQLSQLDTISQKEIADRVCADFSQEFNKNNSESLLDNAIDEVTSLKVAETETISDEYLRANAQHALKFLDIKYLNSSLSLSESNTIKATD